MGDRSSRPSEGACWHHLYSCWLLLLSCYPKWWRHQDNFKNHKNFKLILQLILTWLLFTASVFAKYFNWRIHQCSISMVLSLFLGTAYMLLCVQTQKVQIMLSCLIFNAVVHKGEIQCPPPPFTICSECTRMLCFGPCFRKFSLAGGRTCAHSAPSRNYAP